MNMMMMMVMIVEIIQFYFNFTRITGTLHEDRYTFITVAGRIVLRIMRNVPDKSCRQNDNTHFTFSGNMAHALCMLDN